MFYSNGCLSVMLIPVVICINPGTDLWSLMHEPQLYELKDTSLLANVTVSSISSHKRGIECHTKQAWVILGTTHSVDAVIKVSCTSIVYSLSYVGLAILV